MSDQRSSPKSPSILSALEVQAVRCGLEDGRKAAMQRGLLGFLLLFDRKVMTLSDPKLEVLRRYSEMSRALSPAGAVLPTGPLAEAGYADEEILAILRLIEGDRVA